MTDTTQPTTPVVSQTALNAPPFIAGAAQLLVGFIVAYAAKHSFQLNPTDVLLVVLPIMLAINGIVGSVVSRISKIKLGNIGNIVSNHAVQTVTVQTPEGATTTVPVVSAAKPS